MTPSLSSLIVVPERWQEAQNKLAIQALSGLSVAGIDPRPEEALCRTIDHSGLLQTRAT
jgi:hypothetical protein